MRPNLPRNVRRAWPPNVLRRMTPVEQPSVAREIIAEVVLPALACAAAMAAIAVWLL